MRIKVDRASEAYKRIMSAGFRIANVNLRKSYVGEEKIYTPVIRFECVCGRVETAEGFVYYGRNELPKRLDIAQMIEEAGAVSVQHLKEDGYTEEQITYIRRYY